MGEWTQDRNTAESHQNYTGLTLQPVEIISRDEQRAAARGGGRGSVPIASPGAAAAAAAAAAVVLTAENAAEGLLGQPCTVSGSDSGTGTLVGYKVSGNRHGDTSGGLSSDNYCRVQYSSGSHVGSGWNIAMSYVTVTLPPAVEAEVPQPPPLRWQCT